MNVYDVVVVGAGPAGGQCARELTQSGYKVLLIDKASSYLDNNYSSGGAPLEIMSQFNLPDSIVGTFWDTLRIQSTQSKSIWTSPTPFGPVINFDQLRGFLAEQVEANGGTVKLGHLYQSHQVQSGRIEIQLKDLASSITYSIHAAALVDATGTERKVVTGDHFDKKKAVAATGIEYHVKVDPEIYQEYAKSLNFFLGHHWMPQGYGWIFSMSPFQLKVGVIRYFQNKNYIPHQPTYKPYIEQLLNLCGNYTIEDKHGKTIYYTPGQKDIRFKGPVIAIGDAVSSINPLGWEGIRHAMVSGHLAAEAIENFLKGRKKDFKDYDRAMNSYFGWRWTCSEWMMRSLFKTKRDILIDHSVKAFSRMNNDEIMKVIFDYQFRHSLKSFFWYFISRLTG